MKTTEKIDMFLLDESSYGLFGKEKSKIWTDLNNKIVKIKKAIDVKKMMEKITALYKSKKITLSEFTDLVDKADLKLVKLGK